mgnify:CR=1 FL=1
MDLPQCIGFQHSPGIVSQTWPANDVSSLLLEAGSCMIVTGDGAEADGLLDGVEAAFNRRARVRTTAKHYRNTTSLSLRRSQQRSSEHVIACVLSGFLKIVVLKLMGTYGAGLKAMERI